jgi:hypothetical protein
MSRSASHCSRCAANVFIARRKSVPIKRLLRTLAVCLPLLVGILGGVPMKPEEIEELLHDLNAPKITVTIPGESENGDDPIDDPPDGRN